MRSVFYPRLVNGPFGDPALYVRLAHRGEALLFDCGDLHPLTPRQLLKVRAVFTSHAHIDHLVGFDHLLRTFLYQDVRLAVYGPGGIIERIAGHLRGYTWNLIEGYPFELVVREFGEGGGRQAVFRAAAAFRAEEKRPWHGVGEGLLLDAGHCSVRAVRLDHGDISSLAFALEEPMHVAIHKDGLERHRYRPGPWLTAFKDLVRRGEDPSRPISVPLAGGEETVVELGELEARIAHRERGMKITYVTDASPTPANLGRIFELAVDSHLLVIEAAFSHRELERARERNHLTARMAGEIARTARAARFLVFHHSPRYQESPDLLRKEAEEAFRG